jgi:hypothetical protein
MPNHSLSWATASDMKSEPGSVAKVVDVELVADEFSPLDDMHVKGRRYSDLIDLIDTNN